jgi:hypothetical protein
MIANGVVLNELNLVIDGDATVGQVNSAINSVSGSIIAMESGVPEIVIQIPPATNEDALSALATSLQSMPGILDAAPARLPKAKAWPTSATLAPEANLQHLAASRTMAGISLGIQLTPSCSCTGDSCPTVFVQDQFADSTDHNQPQDFSARMPSVPPLAACEVDSSGACENHGNEVLLVLGAQYVAKSDANNVMLGASPFGNCINVKPVQSSGLSGFKERIALSTALKGYLDRNPTASAIVSSSEGWQDSCTDTDGNAIACSALSTADVLDSVPSGYRRSLEALNWRLRMNQPSRGGDNYGNHVLFSVAAGNEADVTDTGTATPIYPGAGTAIVDWWLTLAAAPTRLSTIAADVTLWAGSPPAFPSQVATPTQIATLMALEAKPQFQAYTGNTLIVGALDAPLTSGPPAVGAFPRLDLWLTTQTAASFSDVFRPGDPGIFAVGNNVLVSCPPAAGCAPGRRIFEDGTSFATPQVSGLAALLWSVDSRVAPALGLTPLDQSPASVTADLIRATATQGPSGKNARSIDALAALLSLDDAAPVTKGTAPVRFAYVDFNGDGVFDVKDVTAFESAYFVAGGPTPQIIHSDSKGKLPDPDFEQFDLNGDGYTGVYAQTTFDLDPTGSTQRGAPTLTAASVKLSSGQVLSFDENHVSDLDVMCFYAYAPAFFDASKDVDGSVRAGLHCGVMNILAVSGVTAGPDGTFTSFGPVSVNDTGQVAFTAFTATGSEGIIADSLGESRVTFAPATNRVYQGAAVNGASPPDVALQDRASGSPPVFFLRRWGADGSLRMVGQSGGVLGSLACNGGPNEGEACGTSADCAADPVTSETFSCLAQPRTPDFDSATGFVDLNDEGVATFLALVNGSTQYAVFAGSSRFNLKALNIFPAGETPLIRPQISNEKMPAIVYRDDSNNVVLNNFMNPTLPATEAVSAIWGDYSSIGDEPGISGDGNIIVFTGTLAGQPTIQLVQRRPDGKTVAPRRFTLVDTSGDPTSAAGQFASFSLTDRVAAVSTLTATGDDFVTVVFAGTRKFTKSDGTSQQVSGAFQVDARVTPDGVLGTAPIRPLIQVGDVLYNGKTVSAVSLWDPISKAGKYKAFLVTFTDGSTGVVRID